MPRSTTLGPPTRRPASARAKATRRALLAAAVATAGVLAVVIGWMAAAPLTTPPQPTAAPIAPTTTAAPTPTPTAAPKPTPAPGRMWSVVVTFYGAADNDPPGSTEIAHPNAHHRAAGGTGTYADPLSLAADPRAIPVGSRVYYPPLQKYFVMEDDCAACIAEWRSSRTPHIDLWTGNYTGAGIIRCEETLTPDGRVAVELNPPPGRSVNPRPLYSAKGCPG